MTDAAPQVIHARRTIATMARMPTFDIITTPHCSFVKRMEFATIRVASGSVKGQAGEAAWRQHRVLGDSGEGETHDRNGLSISGTFSGQRRWRLCLGLALQA